MFRQIALSVAMTAGLAWPAIAQDAPSHDKNLDVQSPMGDLHVGKDADAQKAGLPLYPGARPRQDPNNDPVNLGVFTEAFGLKLVVAKYESDDSPDKVLAFYREKMKKYGKVLECHNAGDNTSVHSDDEDDASKPLTCEGDNHGPVRELKVGTEGNAHIVAIEDPEHSRNAKATSFVIVYLHRHGRSGEI